MDNCPGATTCPAAHEAAEVAVRKTFAVLGIDVDDPKQVSEFNADLRFGATLRRAADKSFFMAVGVITVFLVGALGAGIVFAIRGH